MALDGPPRRLATARFDAAARHEATRTCHHAGMKNTGACPKCRSTELLVVDEARLPNYEFSNAVVPLTLSSHYMETGEKGMLGGAKKGRLSVHLEAYVCGACGFVEWHAKDLDALRAIANEHGSAVRKRR